MSTALSIATASAAVHNKLGDSVTCSELVSSITLGERLGSDLCSERIYQERCAQQTWQQQIAVCTVKGLFLLEHREEQGWQTRRLGARTAWTLRA